MDRLAHARAIVTHLAQHLRADCSVELWNGEILPLGPAARDDIRIRIGSPAAIGRLLRSPRLTTLVEVYLSGDLAITGGSPLEAPPPAEPRATSRHSAGRARTWR